MKQILKGLKTGVGFDPRGGSKAWSLKREAKFPAPNPHFFSSCAYIWVWVKSQDTGTTYVGYNCSIDPENILGGIYFDPHHFTSLTLR